MQVCSSAAWAWTPSLIKEEAITMSKLVVWTTYLCISSSFYAYRPDSVIHSFLWNESFFGSPGVSFAHCVLLMWATGFICCYLWRLLTIHFTSCRDPLIFIPFFFLRIPNCMIIIIIIIIYLQYNGRGKIKLRI